MQIQLFKNDGMVAEASMTMEGPNEWLNQEYALLSNVSTIEALRGQGFITEIIDAYPMPIVLYVTTDNKALGLYRKFGFKCATSFDVSDGYLALLKL
jgi:hypothetical protein